MRSKLSKLFGRDTRESTIAFLSIASADYLFEAYGGIRRKRENWANT
jgi:hypothetical protein